MSAVSRTDSRAPLPALVAELHFALDENGRVNQGSPRNRLRSGTQSDPCISSIRNCAEDPDFPSSVPRSAESRPSAISPKYVAHLADPSSLFAHVYAVSRRHRPSITRTATPLAVVRTSVRVRWFPSPHAPADLQPLRHGRTSPRPPGETHR